MPDFRSPEFLLDHIRHTLTLYDGRDVDPTGGFFHYFRDDGMVFDTRTRHLVSSTRFVFNHAMALLQFGDTECPRDLEIVCHGLRFLQHVHWYDRIWAYSWAHMIDHQHGAWYFKRGNDNRALSDPKSPAGKTDYHTMGACYDVRRGLGQR